MLSFFGWFLKWDCCFGTVSFGTAATHHVLIMRVGTPEILPVDEIKEDSFLPLWRAKEHWHRAQMNNPASKKQFSSLLREQKRFFHCML